MKDTPALTTGEYILIRLDSKGNSLIAPLAINILSLCAISPGAKYLSLSFGQIDALTVQAELYGYRKPNNLDGSTASHFHAFLARQIRGEWE